MPPAEGQPGALKHGCRQAVLALRDALPPAQRAAASQAIVARVLAQDAFAAAETVLLYASMRSEVDTEALFEQCLADGKRLAFPFVDWTRRSLVTTRLRNPAALRPGRWQVPEPPPEDREPLDPLAIDLAIVPGVAFDPEGYRVGYGAAMYDRLLPALRPGVACWGLAFDVQVLDAVPREPHDVPLDAVVTETRWLARETDRA